MEICKFIDPQNSDSEKVVNLSVIMADIVINIVETI